MSRRYLTESEISSALRRGKKVSAFLGAGTNTTQPTIRYVAVRASKDKVTAEVWEVEDPKDPEFLDVYSLYPPNGDDAPDQILSFSSVEELLSALEEKLSGVADRFVNEGMIDDEYADYLAE